MAVGSDFAKALQQRPGQEKISLISKMDCRTDELDFSDFYLWYGGRAEQLYGTYVWCSPYAENSIGLNNDSCFPYSRSDAVFAFGLGKRVLDCLRTDSLHINLFGFVCFHLVSQLLAPLWLQILIPKFYKKNLVY